jgi:hypothetical protein
MECTEHRDWLWYSWREYYKKRILEDYNLEWQRNHVFRLEPYLNICTCDGDEDDEHTLFTDHIFDDYYTHELQEKADIIKQQVFWRSWNDRDKGDFMEHGDVCCMWTPWVALILFENDVEKSIEHILSADSRCKSCDHMKRHKRVWNITWDDLDECHRPNDWDERQRQKALDKIDNEQNEDNK